MATYTPNLGLIKPAGSDNVAVQQLNSNMDTLDEKVHENSVKIDGMRISYPPYINDQNGHWMVYDTEHQVYADSGVCAYGQPATFTASASTLQPGSSATASITGTAENPVLNLGIPKGDKGDSIGFGTVSATVDGTSGTPAVVATASGPDTAKNISFAFSGLKGQDGTIGYTPSVEATVQMLPAGSTPTVTRTGTDRYPVLNFSLPRTSDGLATFTAEATIQTTDWQGASAPYTVTLTNSSILSDMVIVEQWVDNDSDVPDIIRCSIPQSGQLVLSTNTKPSVTLNKYHAAMVLDGTAAITEIETQIATKVPSTRTVNGKALSSNITVNDEDIPSTAVSGQTTVEGALSSLSGQIGNVEIGSVISATTLNELKTNLLATANLMVTNGTSSKLLKFYCRFNDEGFLTGITYSGYLKIIASGNNYLYFVINVSSNAADVISVGYSNGTWIINSLTDQIAGMAYTRINYDASNVTIKIGRAHV